MQPLEDLRKSIIVSPTEDLIKRRKLHLPSDDNPNYTYGLETKQSTPIAKLISNHYQREWENMVIESIYEKKKKEYEEKMKNTKAQESGTRSNNANSSNTEYPTESNRPLVISGPSGSGKSTLFMKLYEKYPGKFGFSISHTTRKPREGEKDGVSYFFVSREEFLKLVEQSAFIEHAEFSGNMYGTSLQAVRSVGESGKICVLDIDQQGVRSIKKTDLNPIFVFIKPPSMEILEQRLRDRNTETEESLQKRLSAVKAELEYAEQPGVHDIIIFSLSLV